MYVKGFRITKIVKQIKFEEACCELEAKKMFVETTMDKILETNCSFHWKQHNTEKVQMLFFRSFFSSKN